MDYIGVIQELAGSEFNVLIGMPSAITFEQKAPSNEQTNFKNKVTSIIDLGKELGIKRLGFTLNRESANFSGMSETLSKNGFNHFSSKVDVYRSLKNLEKPEGSVTWSSLKGEQLSEEDFKHYWEQCMKVSDNQSSTLTMDSHLDSVKAELGEEWKSACRIFYDGNTPIGVVIPHIEPMTMDEGRLFYFGVIPDVQSRGLGTFLHKHALYMLKQQGASYYIGSTHLANVRMQRVFAKNGCTIKGYTESYYYYY